MPSNSVAAVALARIARRQSRWGEGLRLCERAASLNPRDTHLFMDRAWTFSMLRQYGAAAEMIAGALAISPDDPEVLVSKVDSCKRRATCPARAPSGRAFRQGRPADRPPACAPRSFFVSAIMTEPAAWLKVRSRGKNPPRRQTFHFRNYNWVTPNR